MKQKYLSTIFLIIFSATIYAQDFGAVGTQWHYSEHAGGMTPPNSEYFHMESVADTVIDEVTTHKIRRTYYRHNGDTTVYDPLFIFEQADTVRMYNFDSERFQTIYIFNVSAGDTLVLDSPHLLNWTTDTTYRLVIEAVDTIIIDDVPLKRYLSLGLDEFGFWNEGYYMDRIGGLDWFFPRANGIPEAGGPIRCYADNQIDTNFQSIACDYRLYTSVNEEETNRNFTTFPNPTTEYLTIKSDHAIERIELIDLTGKVLHETNQMTIHMGHVNNGFYILRVFFDSGLMSEEKVVKYTF